MSDELIGGRYRVIDCLRTTGFCETYVAEDTHLPGNPPPRCVVKKLQPQSNEDFVLETARRLFDNEAKVLYKLNDHRQIPRLLAHLEVKEEFYLVQEYIEG
ncbi:MAG: serine/threonine protein kinase, partial [Cyanobacteria bacterium J06555_3]